ncbi:DUF5641 domain-containing protein [Trichonephila clavipes]|nr:DUF5641 domain-containing protein [Trichonephila clavipes]
MCTKAVHLELVSSLSAAFLSALRRFVSRRGYPSDIYSDNGTNFVGASAYLKDLFQYFTTLMSRTIRQARTFSGTSSSICTEFRRWSLLMKLKRMFWSRWQLSYLNTLQSRNKWMQGQKDLTVGSLVLIKNPASFSTRWTPGWIVATHPGADGICRVVTIQTSSGVMTRPVSQVAVLPLPPSTTSSRPPEDVKNS